MADTITVVLGNPIPMEGFATHAWMYALWVAVTIGMMVLFLVLMVKSHPRSLLAGTTAFISGILLAFFVIEAVNAANSISGVSGRGIFTEFLHVRPFAYLTLIISALCLSVFVTVTAKYFTGRTLPEKRKRIRVHRGGSNLALDIIRDRHLYLMLLPVLAYYVIFYYLPYNGLRIAFLNFNVLRGIDRSPWVGWKNFITFFTGPNFWNLLRNTLQLSILSLFYGFPVPIFLALLFNELRSRVFRTMTQTIAYIPNFISTMVIAGLVVNFLSPSAGLFNIIRSWFGAVPVYFLTKPEYFRTIYVAQSIWSGAGFGSIIYFSTLQTISTELYEAATIDGAGRFKQVWHVSLPGLSHTIAIMLIMAVGGLLATNVEMIILLYQPVTFSVADTIGTYVYRVGMGAYPPGTASSPPQYSLATAVGLFNGVVAFFLVISANKVSKMLADVNIF